MKRLLILAIAVGAGFALQGCSTLSGMETNKMESASVKVFNAPKEKVVAATEKSIATLGYNLENTKVTETGTQIYFTKSVSAFSWGEVGRIDIEAGRGTAPNTSRVSLSSQKRSKMQVTGMSQADFSREIFAEIERTLALR